MHEADEAIYRRFLKRHNEDDLRLLFDRHRESLILFLMGYVRQEEDAEDLMMETFAVAASGTARFSGRSSFKTWLFAIARNKAGSFLRAQRRTRAAANETAGGDTPSPELATLQEEDRKTLYRALDTLPEDYRQALYLVYFEQMSQDEACTVMQKTKTQMYNLVARGRAKLRETMEKMGYAGEYDDGG